MCFCFGLLVCSPAALHRCQAAAEPGLLILQIQEAHENLSDPAKRREFDSIDEFDDTLPESCAPADFFKVHLRSRSASAWLRSLIVAGTGG